MSEELKKTNDSACHSERLSPCHSERSEESHSIDSSLHSVPFRMTKEGKCHSERSEESHRLDSSVAALPQNDKRGGGNDRDGANDKVKSHFAALCEQAEELRREFPDFKLSEALKDADFIRLTAPGVGVDLRRAFYACNRERLDKLAERRGAEAAREAFAKSLRDNAARPVEGGSGAAELRSDYRHMSGESRAELKKQIRSAAARGKKIYP